MKPGRNDPCPCGSGKKYKKCCGEPGARTPPGQAPLAEAELHFQQGNAAFDRGNLDAALAGFRRATAARNDFPAAHDAAGSALMALNRPAEAEQCFRQALNLAPDFAQAYGNLGNALAEQKRWEAALFPYRRMIDLMPRSAEAHNNLGNALLALHRFKEASDSYRRATNIRPDAAGAQLNLGSALRETGNAQEALIACRRAIALRPELSDAHLAAGNAEFDLGLLDEAQASYQRAIELQPSASAPRLALAKVLRQIGRSHEARECAREARRLSPEEAEVLALLGELEVDFGRFSEAEALLRRALTLSPDLADAWAALTRVRKMTRQDSDWWFAVEQLLQKPMSMGQEINLRYAVGKYFDDLEEYDKAFENYRRANELKKLGGTPYKSAAVARRVTDITQLYDAEWFRTVGAASDLSALPVFVVGMPRSGTTLIEQILASHPQGHGAGELRFWHSATVRYEALRRAGKNESAPAELARNYLALLTSLAPNAARIVDKMPANYMNLGLIHIALPGSRIIHMQRNPLDTALSIYFQVFSNTHAYANDLSEIAQHYREYLRLMQHWRTLLPTERFLEISYEALVQEPELWIRKLLDFVGLPFDARCLDFHRTERAVATASNWQVRQKISSGSAGRWRHYERFLGPLRSLTLEGELA
ncbi:MAG TPA: sulfotransferase [Steroidobacteraceae bacterium]